MSKWNRRRSATTRAARPLDPTSPGLTDATRGGRTSLAGDGPRDVYEVGEKEIPPQTVVIHRRPMSDQDADPHAAVMEILAWLGPDAHPVGAPFAIYHEPSDATDPAAPEHAASGVNLTARADEEAIDVAVPVHGHPGRIFEGARVVTLPTTRVVFTVHPGTYARIGAAYEAVYRFIREHAREPAGPPREIYLVGPKNAADAADFRTELQVPIL